MLEVISRSTLPNCLRDDRTILKDLMISGAGKTLMSAMVIHHMLDLNPCHCVVFLVDRVLLVTQQSKVLQYELGDMSINRYV